jgi:hypothetical protein
MPVQIDWEGLIVGFESRSHQIPHFFDRETGDVEQVLERDAERHASMSGDPRFLGLPRDAGARSVGDLQEFLAECEDEACRRKLSAALESPGSVGLYREALLGYPKEEARFFHFKEKQALRRAQEWLAAQGIAFQKRA